jgi:uncharacterized protein (DUF697 family)
VLRFGDVSNIWNTIKEINVAEIRENGEQPVRLSVIGDADLRAAVLRALHLSTSRYPPAGRAIIHELDLPLSRERQHEAHNADLALLVVDGRRKVSADESAAADWLARLAIPKLVLLIGDDRAPEVEGGTWYLPDTRVVLAPGVEPASLAETLMPAIVDELPEDLRVAAARRLPGLRNAVAQWLIGDVSFSNATFALTSGIPQMVPLLSLPLSAADIVVLTKNQALMTYRLALAFGAPSNFQAQMTEVMPVIGGGFMWRQIARQLVALIPFLGLVAKTAVAYAGTYATGQVAATWYRNGEVITGDALKRLYHQASELGQQRAREIIRRRNRELPPPANGTDADTPPQNEAEKQRWRFRRK